mmetsp:Transcript_27303/g.73899  ORF Transcript_27303/g.73899 Transcript_27303/m.73899 type:complete len:210 (-) Transcript_27303:661-1290(-)
MAKTIPNIAQHKPALWFLRHVPNYFHNLMMLWLLSASFFMTLATAISKSSCVTWIRLSLRANIPASVHTALHSAPDAFDIFSPMTLRSMPRNKFILREWMVMMSTRAVKVGFGNSILRSMRPGRRRAASSVSIRFVAMITLMFCVGSKPSSWLSSSSMVRCTSESPPSLPSTRALPIESISSMKIIDGAASRAMMNSSRTMREPSPMYF